MSCKLQNLVSFKDKLPTIKNILFADDFKSPVPNSIEDWSGTFHKDHDDLSSQVSAPESLNDSIISISPFGDIVVFANGSNVAVYRCREDNDSQICGTTLFELESGEVITSVSCLPFVSQQISNHGRPDWCSIILGFNSGYIRIYTENMSLLLAQKFSHEPITSIKIQGFFCPYVSGRTQNSECSKKLDEVFIFTRSACLIIEGFVFYQTLRSCRNYLARNSNRSAPDLSVNPEFALRYKQWMFKNFKEVMDADNCGLSEINEYDYLVSRSLNKGAYASLRGRPSNSNLIISTGEDPFIGLHRTDENDSTSVLEEVTQAVVNKVKNVLPSFLRSSEKPRQKIEQPLEFSHSLELFDQYRIGVTISISPNRELAAICDDFGRVTLISLIDGLAIRMWKGYRDAQVGWIESQEDPKNVYSKKVLFLCIYAPKRGLLEIWRCQHGLRVDAFNVGKSSRLLYCGYSMLGLNDILINQYRQSFNLFLNSPSFCYLFDFETCTLYSIQVPFVASLTDNFNQTSKDELFLKEFKSLTPQTSEQVYLSLFDKMIIHQIKWEAISHSLSLSNVSLVSSLSSKFLQNLKTESSQGSDKIDSQTQALSQCCSKLLQLCSFYQSFQSLLSSVNGLKIYSSIHKSPPDIESQAEALNWSPRDYVRCVSIFSFREVVFPEEETTISPSPLSFAEFVDFFDLETHQSAESGTDLIFLKNHEISPKISSLHRLGDFLLFPGLVHSNLEKCASHIEAADLIAPQDILYSLYASWLNSELSSDWNNWPLFNRYVRLIINLVRKRQTIDSSNWLLVLKTLCCLIAQSTRITSALIASLTLQTVYTYFESCEEATKMTVDSDETQKTESGNWSTEEWESLSIEKEKLHLLINQLESVFFLTTTLHSNPDHNPGDISLALLMESNPGIISESIAKWIISYPLEPAIILSIYETSEFDENDAGTDGDPMITTGLDIVSSLNVENLLTHDVAKQLLQKVRDQFPHSLETDVILANCAWECISLWDKDPSMSASKLLSQSLKYLGVISSAVLKHNVACLIWKIAIRKRFETLAHLMEKMGKTPKDRILKRDVGLEEGSLEIFVSFTIDLLDMIIDTLALAESEALPLFRLDEWWKHRIWANSQLPLVFIAVQQKPADPELILQIYDLAIVINLIVNFQMKQFKPLSMFPLDVKKVLFGELCLNLTRKLSDSLLTENRSKFLQSAASIIAQSVPPSSSLCDEEIQFHSIANQWLGKVINLAKHWEMNADFVRRRYICDLYLNGCDKLAEEVINMVQDREELAKDLLVIAGHRVVHLIRNEREKFISLMPPNIFIWLENLPSNVIINQDIEASSTKLMIEYIISFLSEDNVKSKIASNLLKIVKRLLI